MSRYTNIICTVGPVSANAEMLVKMSKRGMNVTRLNFSHGDHEQHQMVIDLVRSVNAKHKCGIKILQDLEGYRIRLGKFKKPVHVENNATVYLNPTHNSGGEGIPFDYEGDVKDIDLASNVFIDDGQIHLRVTGYSGKRLKTKAIQGGFIKERKGVNIPGLEMQFSSLTPKDENDLELGLKNNVDMIAQSFVRNRKDIQRVVDIVRPKIPDCVIFAKIENEEGLRNLDSILEVCDGVIVARGDLGVTMPIYKLPMIQKYIIRHCSRKKKLAVTATQMLDSMIENGRPTRAEVSDVANAILDGSDYVMLSGETAVGRFPSRSIQVMDQIVRYTEKYQFQRPR